MWEAPQVPNSPKAAPEFRIRHLRCLPHSGIFTILTVRANDWLAPTSLRDQNLCIIRAKPARPIPALLPDRN